MENLKPSSLALIALFSEYWILAGSQESSLRNFQTELNTKAKIIYAGGNVSKHTKDDFPKPERLQNTGFLGKMKEDIDG